MVLSWQQRWGLIAVVTALMLPFQNCSVRTAFSSSSRTQLSGNGNGYGGKPIYFEQFDPSRSCSGRSLTGRPFPNRMIFATSAAVTLVRDNCLDLAEPIVIPPSQYSVDISGQFIVYQGQRFDVNSDLSEYNLIPPLCPGTRVPTGLQTPNLMASPLDLTAPVWERQTAAGVSLHGSIAALPRFKLEHIGPDLESWQRTKQWINVDANREYAASFLVERGNAGFAYFVYWVDDGNLGTKYGIDVVIDIATGAVVYTNTQGTGLTGFSVKTQNYGTGLAFTVFFRHPTAERGSFGVSASTGTPGLVPLGTYIFGTAADLKPVDGYCQP